MEGRIDFSDPKAYTLVRKDNRHLYLKIRAGRLEVVAPRRMSREAIESVLERRREWIEKRLGGQKAPWRYLGNPLRLRLDPEIGGCTLEGDLLRAPTRQSAEAFFRRRAEEVLFPLTRRWAEHMGLPLPVLTVRKMKRRYGTCYPRRPQINYNLWLVMESPRKIEEVVVHELLHLLYPDHGRPFRKALSDRMGEPSLWDDGQKGA